MSPLPPPFASPFTPELRSFLEGPNSTMVAGRDEALVPALARAVALRCEPDGKHVTVVLPEVPAARLLALLAPGAPVAIVTELPTTHKTIQLKGHVVARTTTPDGDRASVEAAGEAFFAQLALLGLPRNLTERLVRWPATSVRVAVAHVFEQSPGPGAGEPLAKAPS